MQTHPLPCFCNRSSMCGQNATVHGWLLSKTRAQSPRSTGPTQLCKLSPFHQKGYVCANTASSSPDERATPPMTRGGTFSSKDRAIKASKARQSFPSNIQQTQHACRPFTSHKHHKVCVCHLATGTYKAEIRNDSAKPLQQSNAAKHRHDATVCGLIIQAPAIILQRNKKVSKRRTAQLPAGVSPMRPPAQRKLIAAAAMQRAAFNQPGMRQPSKYQASNCPDDRSLP